MHRSKVLSVMRITVCALGPEPASGLQMSGGTRFLIEMLRRWPRENEVLVLCSSGAKVTFSNALNQKSKRKSKVHLVAFDTPTFRNAGKIFGMTARLIRLVFRCPKLKQGVVFAPSDFLWDTVPCAWLKLRNPNARFVGVVWHLVPSPWQRAGASFLQNVLSHFSQRASLLILAIIADRVLVPTRSTMNQLRHILGKKLCVALSGGIDFQKITELPEEKKIFDACYLGRLHPAKGIFDLIQVWARVVYEKKDAKLAIIGGGPASVVRRLRKDIDDNHLENNVTLFGEVSHQAVLRLVKKCKILVQPSHEEGFSIAVCEALACGLPVIAYDLPVYRELYADAVIEVPKGDIDSMAKETVSLILDNQRRTLLAQKGISQARKYDWNYVAKRVAHLMQVSTEFQK